MTHRTMSECSYHGYKTHVEVEAGTRNSSMKDRPDDPLHHERPLLPRLQATTHVEVEEAQDPLVGEDVDGVAGETVDDGQPVHVVVDEFLHGVVQTRVRVDAHKRPLLVLQNFCKHER